MSPKRNIYLETVTLAEAVNQAVSNMDRERLIRPEMIPAHGALGRVTSRPVFARYSSPTFHSAAMDGIAVKAESTFSAREGAPVVLAKGRDFDLVNTGNVLPHGRDAVIMVEHLVPLDQDQVSIEAPVFPWQNVRRIGEDIVATELLLPQNHIISAYDIGALLSGGIFDVEVWEQVRLVVIPTGNEILDFTLRPVPKPGQVVESNSQMVTALAKTWGCLVERVAPINDDLEALTEAVIQGLSSKAHIVMIGAGSSAGTKDYTKAIIERVGRVLVHGVSAMPGKPTLVGEARGKLIIGSPGYPVSTAVCLEEVVKPVVYWLTRRRLPKRPKVTVELTRKVPGKLGMLEFIRMAIGKVGEKWMATPLPKGAGLITSLTKAQGIVRIPPDREGLEGGAMVEAELLVPESELEQVLVIIGSHDNTLDLLANELMGLAEPIGLASTHVGSMGGLSAIRNGSTMMAGAHLFDPATDDYNFPFLAKYLPDVPVKVVNLAIRHQGLIVGKGNPLGIQGVKDLARSEVIFINRQKGAGTRILLDDHLKKAGILSDQVRGYDKEETTHMAVAVNVLSGTASCGLGIYAAAKALGLDFVPLARERYDLIIPVRFLEDQKVKTVLSLLDQKEFQNKIAALGGYEVTLTGQEMQAGVKLGESA